MNKGMIKTPMEVSTLSRRNATRGRKMGRKSRNLIRTPVRKMGKY